MFAHCSRPSEHLSLITSQYDKIITQCPLALAQILRAHVHQTGKDDQQDHETIPDLTTCSGVTRVGVTRGGN